PPKTNGLVERIDVEIGCALGGLLWHVRFLRESFRIVCGVYMPRPRSIGLKSQRSQEIMAMVPTPSRFWEGWRFQERTCACIKLVLNAAGVGTKPAKMIRQCYKISR